MRRIQPTLADFLRSLHPRAAALGLTSFYRAASALPLLLRRVGASLGALAACKRADLVAKSVSKALEQRVGPGRSSSWRENRIDQLYLIDLIAQWGYESER